MSEAGDVFGSTISSLKPADPTVVSDTQGKPMPPDGPARKLWIAQQAMNALGRELQRKVERLDRITAYALEAQKTPIAREDMHDHLKALAIFDEHKGLLNLVLSETK